MFWNFKLLLSFKLPPWLIKPVIGETLYIDICDISDEHFICWQHFFIHFNHNVPYLKKYMNKYVLFCCVFLRALCFLQINSNAPSAFGANPLCTHHLQTLKRCMEGAVCLFFRPSSSSVSIKRFSRLWSAPISNSGVFIPDWPDSPHLALLCLSSQTDCWEEVGDEGEWEGGGSTLHVDCWRLFAVWIPSHSWKIVF